MKKHFIPVAAKVGNQRHLIAIRDSFMVTMPLMILGALAVMINNLPIPGFQKLMNSIFGGSAWQGFGVAVWNGTFGVLSVFIAFLVAYNHCRRNFGRRKYRCLRSYLWAFRNHGNHSRTEKS